MRNRLMIGEDVFESGCELVEVTSLRRPDTSWRHVDAAGHEHRWFMNGAPATSYDPAGKFSTPTLKWVVDGTEYYEDGDPYEVGHMECPICGEHVRPRSTADDHAQYIPGLRWFAINGEHVSQEEFTRRLPH